MPKVIVTVLASIEPGHEEEFNRWYNEEHAPQVLQLQSCVAATRFRSIAGHEETRYLATYEFDDEAAFDAFWESDDMHRLVGEYDAAFGELSERQAGAYVQIWPS